MVSVAEHWQKRQFPGQRKRCVGNFPAKGTGPSKTGGILDILTKYT